MRVLSVDDFNEITENIYLIDGLKSTCQLMLLLCNFDQHAIERLEFTIQSVNIDLEIIQAVSFNMNSISTIADNCFLNKYQSIINRTSGKIYVQIFQI